MKRVFVLVLVTLFLTLAPAASALEIGAQALFFDGDLGFYGGTLGLGYPITLRGHAMATANYDGFRFTMMGGDILLNLKLGPIIPYGGAGISIISLRIEGVQGQADHPSEIVLPQDPESLIFPYAVGGVALAITEQIEIYGEYRHMAFYHEDISLGDLTFPAYGAGLRLRF